MRKALVFLLLACLAPSSSALAKIKKEHWPSDASPLLQRLVNQARNEAQQDYAPVAEIDEDAISDLGYQDYKSIRFKAESAIWRGLYPYEVQLFHSGFLFKRPVKVNIIDYQNRISQLPFDSRYFSYESEKAKAIQNITSNIGFAGFRVHYPLNSTAYKDELAAFLGATYFRLIGQHQKYGLSARGLAIDTAMAEGEEFPYFTEFWLIEPANKKVLSFYAKMDSPSITGIYKFTLRADKNAKADIQAWLFAREDIDKLGLAPFTSMFLYGENTLNKPDDYRPEVHDSDGIMLDNAAGEQIWRPLNNPKRLRITSLADSDPKGFGMLQRDIQYSNYLDSEAFYHQRPGFWVTPKHGFDKGRLELVEIPTNSETHDNIVAYWVNDTPIEEGDELYVEYRLETVSGNLETQKQARVLRTLQGSDRLPGEPVDEDNLTRRFIIDFTMPDDFDFDSALSKAEVNTTDGQIAQINLFPTNYNNELRTTFLFTPDEDAPMNDLRVVLTHKGQSISEVWTYAYER